MVRTTIAASRRLRGNCSLGGNSPSNCCFPKYAEPRRSKAAATFLPRGGGGAYLLSGPREQPELPIGPRHISTAVNVFELDRVLSCWVLSYVM